MSDVAIRVSGLSKRYRLGRRAGYRTLRDSLASAAKAPARLLRRSTREAAPTLWALKDVSFEVEHGHVVGVIGRNGAGKSTLLKILSRITEPTAGRAETWGRVGSLLEVGTGFHPELTGRENVFMNGAILGMRNAEIRAKFDEIVAFAEVEKFIDTPVKHYSSGMYTRLAFAVAAHLEPEILVVDEVLAVGDAEFQKKCMGKMRNVSRSGRTVVFVSHNMGAIVQLCSSCILLDAGGVKTIGRPAEVARQYLASGAGATAVDSRSFQGTLVGTIRFQNVHVSAADAPEAPASVVSPASPIRVTVGGVCEADVPHFRVTLSVYREGVRLLTMHDVKTPTTLGRGPFTSTYEIPPYFLRPGEYSLAVGGYRDGMNEYIWGTDLLPFTVAEEWSDQYDPINIGWVNVPYYGRRLAAGPTGPGVAPEAAPA